MRKYMIKQLHRSFSERIKTWQGKVNSSVDHYKKLRIYKESSTLALIRSRLVWTVCERDILVDNGEQLYKLSTSILGT
jgi:hypothetical protein